VQRRHAGAGAALLDTLAERLGPKLHSLWWNGNPERTNVVLGSHFWRHSGRELVEERFGGASVFFPPAAFGQNNLDLFEAMLEEIHALVPPGRDVVELYAGCGAIGLGLVERSRSLSFNELGAASLAGLARGIEALGPERGSRARVIAGSAETAAAAIGPDSIVIVDPPRKGLESSLLASLSSSPPERKLAPARRPGGVRPVNTPCLAPHPR
jgi:23S rRNA (uracil1939-C5)-methyltransferase